LGLPNVYVLGFRPIFVFLKTPAQTKLLNLDFQVSKYKTVYMFGKVTSSQKSDTIACIDELLEAVKIAHSKANNAEVKNIKIKKVLKTLFFKTFFNSKFIGCVVKLCFSSEIQFNKLNCYVCNTVKA
jgi:hypothetical protein